MAGKRKTLRKMKKNPGGKRFKTVLLSKKKKVEPKKKVPAKKSLTVKLVASSPLTKSSKKSLPKSSKAVASKRGGTGKTTNLSPAQRKSLNQKRSIVTLRKQVGKKGTKKKIIPAKKPFTALEKEVAKEEGISLATARKRLNTF